MGSFTGIAGKPNIKKLFENGGKVGKMRNTKLQYKVSNSFTQVSRSAQQTSNCQTTENKKNWITEKNWMWN